MADDLILVKSLALPFLLSLPKEKMAQEGEVPVLCFLHGLDEGPPADIYKGITAHGPLKGGSSPLATEEFIVAAPQLPIRGDYWGRYADMVCEMAAYLQSEHHGDRRRTYLTGFSFGGNGVFDIALHAPSLWAALWPVDPTRVPISGPGLPIWFSAGEASRWNARGFIDRLQLQPPDSGAEDRVYVDEGVGHVSTATSAYRSDTVYRWLLSKHS